jgi:hypothetical protein
MSQRLRSVKHALTLVGIVAFVLLVGFQPARAIDDNKDRIGVRFESPKGARLTLQATYLAHVTRTDPGLSVHPTNCLGCQGAATYPYSRTWTELAPRDTTVNNAAVPFPFSFRPSSEGRLTIALPDGQLLYGLITIGNDPSGFSRFQDYRLTEISRDKINSVLSGVVQTIWLFSPQKDTVVTLQLGTKCPW